MKTINTLLTPRRFLLLLAGIAAVAVLLLAYSRTQASGTTTPSDYFICTPQQVGAFTNRVHVRCVPSAPGSIAYFAYCSNKDSAASSRFLSVFTTSKVTGKNIAIYYNPNDTTGTSCGCSSVDCRVITGAEVMP